jgi:RNA polymerase sigma-70 factor (ECF subfamily)
VAQDSTLQSLINRMNSGDPAAKALLLAQTYERLRRLARKMLRQDFLRLKEREDTDDVLQNAAIRLNRAMQAVTLRDARQFFRLAATTIRRELLDLARHYGRTHAKDHPQRASAARQRAAAAEPSDSTYEPATLHAWTEFHKQVDALPEAERDVFDLIWYQGLTQTEAAALLRIPRATVQRHWLKGRLRLKEVLDRKQWGLLVSSVR